MSWYNLGTVTLTTGSAIVDGAGTAFVGNVIAGQALLTPDGRLMEIAEVISATRLRLVRAYAGGSVGGVVYDIIPTSADLTTVIERLNTLITRYRDVVDGVGQGLFSDGAPTSPAVRFTADQDTGLYRLGTNAIGFSAGGVQRMAIESDGSVRVGTTANGGGIEIPSPYGWVSIKPDGATAGAGARITYTWANGGQGSLIFARADGEVARFDPVGHLLVGTVSGATHTIQKAGGQGTQQLDVAASAKFYACSAGFGVSAATGLAVAYNTTTGRGIQTDGTINAAGQDYAEYMTKADGCGTIAKGDVCGVDRDGRLTKTWADAISFVIKSTDPSYVGGDTWGQSVGPRPEGLGEEPAAPIAPPAAPASDEEADVAAWRVILAAYPGQLAAYQATHSAWAAAKDAYDTALPAWEAALEVERQKVDRIAFAGQVPVNVSGDFAVGDYIIAVASGAAIKAVAVPADGIPLDVYLRRVGKVWAVRDGRAWVDVQHG